MELQPHTTEIRDPFFAALRRRHADVDIVLLPPETQAPAGDPVPGEQVTPVLERVAAQMHQLWGVIGQQRDDLRTRISYGPVQGTVVASSRGVAVVEEGSSLLARLRHELESGGWRPRRLDGVTERLAGRLGDLRLHASYAEATGTLLVDLTAAPMPVGTVRARALVRGA